MPAGYDLEGMMSPDQGLMPGQGEQARNMLAQIIQAQQPQQGMSGNPDGLPMMGPQVPPPQMPPPQMPQMPQMPPQMPQELPLPNNPDGVPGLGPSAIRPGMPQPNNPDGVPGLGPQSSSAFKLPRPQGLG